MIHGKLIIHGESDPPPTQDCPSMHTNQLGTGFTSTKIIIGTPRLIIFVAHCSLECCQISSKIGAFPTTRSDVIRHSLAN